MKNFLHFISLLIIVFIFGACENTPKKTVSTENAISSKSSNRDNQTASIPNKVIPKTEITFDELVHDFGVIEERDEVSHVFTFTNTGNEVLIINSVKGNGPSSFTKERIPVGGTGQVEVIYGTKNRLGKKRSTWKVNANTHQNLTRLIVKMDIVKSK